MGEHHLMARNELADKFSVDITSLIAAVVAEELEDASTLRACALVSRSWRLGTKPYIFQRILLCDEKSLAEFDHLLRTSPDVQGYVRELTLCGRVPSRDDPRIP